MRQRRLGHASILQKTGAAYRGCMQRWSTGARAVSSSGVCVTIMWENDTSIRGPSVCTLPQTPGCGGDPASNVSRLLHPSLGRRDGCAAHPTGHVSASPGGASSCMDSTLHRVSEPLAGSTSVFRERGPTSRRSVNEGWGMQRRASRNGPAGEGTLLLGTSNARGQSFSVPHTRPTPIEEYPPAPTAYARDIQQERT